MTWTILRPHAGIKNAVAQVTALLAVAVFGVLMLRAFNGGIAERLDSMPVSSEARAQILGQSVDFVNLKILDCVSSVARRPLLSGRPARSPRGC